MVGLVGKVFLNRNTSLLPSTPLAYKSIIATKSSWYPSSRANLSFYTKSFKSVKRFSLKKVTTDTVTFELTNYGSMDKILLWMNIIRKPD